MRLIDADAITYESIDSSDTGRHWQYHGTGVIAVRKEDIDKMDTIHPEPYWIPVEQGLPKIGEYVLCETITCYFGKYHVCKFVDKDEWVDRPHFDWDRNGFPCVVAWTRFEPHREVIE